MTDFTPQSTMGPTEHVAELKRAVQKCLDRHLQPNARIDVALRGAVPVLRGRVYSTRSYADVEQCVREISGSKHVVNQLLIKVPDPQIREADRQLETTVRNRLRDAPSGGLEELDIHVAAGIVVMRGIVETARQRIVADGWAAGVPGIRNLRNQIVVLSSPAARDRRIAEHLVERFNKEPLHGTDLPMIEVTHSTVHVRREGIETRLLNQLEQAASSTPGIKGFRVNRLAVSPLTPAS